MSISLVGSFGSDLLLVIQYLVETVFVQVTLTLALKVTSAPLDKFVKVCYPEDLEELPPSEKVHAYDNEPYETILVSVLVASGVEAEQEKDTEFAVVSYI